MDLEEDPLDKIGFDFNKKTLFYYDDIIGTYNYSMGYLLSFILIFYKNNLKIKPFFLFIKSISLKFKILQINKTKKIFFF